MKPLPSLDFAYGFPCGFMTFDLIASDSSATLDTLHFAAMRLDYKFVKGYQVDEERACKLAKVESTLDGRMKCVRVATRMIDRKEYATTTVGYRDNDLQETYYFIFVLDFGDDCDELEKREVNVAGKDTLLRAAEYILSGPFVYVCVYVN
ncbi:hypothetical protein BD779DRAFT_1682551 [Infundibulicybe gibba]|nr:hypothetical protein BD779DRAFT_1682551 [Infundibulicybe gibba]